MSARCDRRALGEGADSIANIWLRSSASFPPTLTTRYAASAGTSASCRSTSEVTAPSFASSVPRQSLGSLARSWSITDGPGTTYLALSNIESPRRTKWRMSRIPDRDHETEHETGRTQRPPDDGNPRDPFAAQCGIVSDLSQRDAAQN